jgi:methionine-rich copper-binding protein CopC
MGARAVAALAAATCCLGLGAATALGHDEIESSRPRGGAVLARTPATVTLIFAEPIGRLGRVTATRNGQGDLVKSARTAPRDAAVVVVRLKRPGPKKQAGTYTVRWRIISDDGHPVSGVVTFRVRRT